MSWRSLTHFANFISYMCTLKLHFFSNMVFTWLSGVGPIFDVLIGEVGAIKSLGSYSDKKMVVKV